MAKQDVQVQKKEAKELETAERTRWGKVFAPPIDIIETKNELRMYVDMPGVQKDSINIMIDKGVLTISGNLADQPFEDKQLIYQEYEIGDYQRSFTLTDTINQDKIEANYKHGVLEMILPKAEQAKPKTITVKTS
jgi:HSP20 family molecular chaperone IbpA